MLRKRNNKILSLIICLVVTLTFHLVLTTAERTSYGPPIDGEGYTLSRSLVSRELSVGEFTRDSLVITNLQGNKKEVSLVLTGDITNIIQLEETGTIIDPFNESEVFFIITAKEYGVYSGELVLSGSIDKHIPINITVINESQKREVFVEIEPQDRNVILSKPLEFKTVLTQVKKIEKMNVSLQYLLIGRSSNNTYVLQDENITFLGSLHLNKGFELPPDIQKGYYTIQVTALYDDKDATAKSEVLLVESFFAIKVFGIIPVWLLLTITGTIIGGILIYRFVMKEIEKRKKYKMQVYFNTLPKKSPTALYLGKIAETNVPAYLDVNNLTTHGVVAGATGGGKSIAAQVLVEEALMKNIAVVVFDPTAQWSGMLRKCEDKRMISLYPKFGLKETDARAFPGNVKQIKDAHQSIDIKKYINPGQINIFALNKLDPAEIDIFVATAIISIFRSSPEEHPGLRVLLVFDEVHRLLPKFGGTGKGFLQIERACREFRKWGFGVLLVSQVLSDFVGEIKANINTEAQMRTRDEADLHRLKTKYGEEFLQSLIKASIGVGMFVNPAYNRGKPYFIGFRPILHNTRRLSDEILEKYFKYSETIEDIEYQIEQLEAEKVDIFDLKMELKLIKDKLMTGNFTVVDIYLEGLAPRLAKQWATLGKKPKQRQLQLLSESDVNASAAAAQAERAKWEKEHGTAPAAAAQAAAIDITLKIVKPLTFDNGVSISSLKELSEVLPGLEAGIFKVHVNKAKNKNDIAAWLEKEIDPALAAKIKELDQKKDIINEIDVFMKAHGTQKKEAKESPAENKDKSAQATENKPQ